MDYVPDSIFNKIMAQVSVVVYAICQQDVKAFSALMVLTVELRERNTAN